ncbi:MAG: recombinase family protein [Thermomicrobiales bacterium]
MATHPRTQQHREPRPRQPASPGTATLRVQLADETRSRYVENPDTAWVVRLIFERIADGMPKRTLARWLDEQGIATPGGSKRWRCLAIDQMVRSPMYRGEATVYLTKSVKTKDGKTRRINRETSQGDDGFIELPDGVVPALVSEETWKAANHALDHGDKYRSTRYAAGKDPQDVLVRGHRRSECGYKCTSSGWPTDHTSSLPPAHGRRAIVPET